MYISEGGIDVVIVDVVVPVALVELRQLWTEALLQLAQTLEARGLELDHELL